MDPQMTQMDADREVVGGGGWGPVGTTLELSGRRRLCAATQGGG